MKHKLNQVIVDNIDEKPEIINFYPLTTHFDSQKKVFSYEEVIGLFISQLTNKKIHDFDDNAFKEKCLQVCAEKMNDTSHLDIIEHKYFCGDKLILDSLLSYQTYKPSNNSQKVYKIFEQLLNSEKINIDFETHMNFLDKIMISELHKFLKPGEVKQATSSYLPFLEVVFNKDLQSLSKNRHYFKQNIERFFELYFFLYAAQLALNIHPMDNALKVPEPKELYFILNHEKASQERSKIEDKGYKNLQDKIKYIFPYLSLLSDFAKLSDDQDLRLYQFLSLLDDDSSSIAALDHYRKTYRDVRQLPELNDEVSDSFITAIKRLFDSAYEQFKKDNVVDRYRANNKYISAFERQIAKPFLVNRRRAGNILVLDQDTILLLTNICIESQEKVESKKMRFHNLLKEFQARGIFFDSKSQTELIELYERVGNIERKSDSGDAVYVKSTI